MARHLAATGRQGHLSLASQHFRATERSIGSTPSGTMRHSASALPITALTMVNRAGATRQELLLQTVIPLPRCRIYSFIQITVSTFIMVLMEATDMIEWFLIPLALEMPLGVV